MSDRLNPDNAVPQDAVETAPRDVYSVAFSLSSRLRLAMNEHPDMPVEMLNHLIGDWLRESGTMSWVCNERMRILMAENDRLQNNARHMHRSLAQTRYQVSLMERAAMVALEDRGNWPFPSGDRALHTKILQIAKEDMAAMDALHGLKQ